MRFLLTKRASEHKRLFTQLLQRPKRAPKFLLGKPHATLAAENILYPARPNKRNAQVKCSWFNPETAADDDGGRK